MITEQLNYRNSICFLCSYLGGDSGSNTFQCRLNPAIYVSENTPACNFFQFRGVIIDNVATMKRLQYDGEVFTIETIEVPIVEI